MHLNALSHALYTYIQDDIMYAGMYAIYNATYTVHAYC